jgi:putative NADH-flavin reductase
MTAIAIFGVSGRTGQALAAGARARGWSVRGFGRISSEAPVGTVMIHGRFEDAARLHEVIRGTDAVCCVLGPRPPYTDVFCAAATRAIIAAMDVGGRRRLLCVTGAMVGDGRSRSRSMTWLAALLRWRRPGMVRDRAEQEEVVAASALDWTLIKPPRLTDAHPTGRVAAGPDVPVGLLSSISRADLAAFLLDAISDPTLVRQRVIVRQRS